MWAPSAHMEAHKELRPQGCGIGGCVPKLLGQTAEIGISGRKLKDVVMYLATKGAPHELEVHSLVHEGFRCQSEAMLLPVHRTVDLHPQYLLNQVLQRQRMIESDT